MKEIIGCRATVPEIIGRIDAVMDRIEMHLRLGRRIFILIPRLPSETAAGSGKTLPSLNSGLALSIGWKSIEPKATNPLGDESGEKCGRGSDANGSK